MTNTFSERLKKLRKEKNLTQVQLSNKISVNQGTYSRWEKGTLEPNFEKLFLLAQHLETTTDYLLGKTDNKEIVKYNEGEKGIDYTLETLIVLFGEEETLKKFNANNLDEVKNQIRQQFQKLAQQELSKTDIKPNPPVPKSGNSLETTETK